MPEETPPSRLARGATSKPLYPAGRLLRANVQETTAALHEARAELANIRAECERQISAARDEADRIREEAALEGRRAAAVDVAKLMASVTEAIDRVRLRLAEDAARVVLDFARTVLESELSVRPDAIVSLVRATLADAARCRRVAIIMHPKDLEPVRAASDALQASLPLAESIEFRDDDAVPRFSCRIDTDMGWIDGSLQEHLGNLYAQAALGAAARPSAGAGAGD